mgnify:CR=1 FL=1
MCRSIFGNVLKLAGHNLENVESSAEFFESLKTDCKLFQIPRNVPRKIPRMIARKIPRKIPCFQYCVILCGASLR